MVQDLAKVRAFVCHGSRSELAQPNTMPLTGSSDEHIVALFVDYEVIAGHGIPAEAATEI